MGFRHVSVMSQVSKKKMSRVRIVTVDGRSVQRFAEHFVCVPLECYYQRVRGHDGLCVVSLLRGLLVWQTDGVVDVVVPPVGFEPYGVLAHQSSRHVRLLV